MVLSQRVLGDGLNLLNEELKLVWLERVGDLLDGLVRLQFLLLVMRLRRRPDPLHIIQIHQVLIHQQAQDVRGSLDQLVVSVRPIDVFDNRMLLQPLGQLGRLQTSVELHPCRLHTVLEALDPLDSAVEVLAFEQAEGKLQLELLHDAVLLLDCVDPLQQELEVSIDLLNLVFVV
jgi:hypothetical protein